MNVSFAPLCALVLLHAGLFDNNSEDHSDHSQVIAQATIFAYGPTGFAGTISQAETSLRFLINNDPAGNSLITILETEDLNPAAYAYAIWGLHLLDDERYRAYAEALTENHENLQWQQGCIVSDVTTTEWVRALENGDFNNRESGDDVDDATDHFNLSCQTVTTQCTGWS